VSALLKLKAQILVDGEIALGPGKADLLDAIEARGSISAAARELGLSYRRAWMMVDAMNRLFADPPVQTLRGGTGGARLTPAGQALLADYRALQQALAAAARAEGEALLARLSPSVR
jgi:molybdate transport system regulatory protein